MQRLGYNVSAFVSGDVAALPRGTPLYGQPSWWGDGDADDENSFKQEIKSSNKKHDGSVSGRNHSNFELLTSRCHYNSNGSAEDDAYRGLKCIYLFIILPKGRKLVHCYVMPLFFTMDFCSYSSYTNIHNILNNCVCLILHNI